MIISIWMERLLNESQLDRLSETLSNFGLLLFASMVVPAFTKVEGVDEFTALLGLIGSLSSFVVSLSLLKGVER